jgi:cyanophycin synthetase
MRIESIRTFSGANIYKDNPAILIRLGTGDLQGRESREIRHFNQKLLEIFPRLNEHFCTLGRPGGFVERLNSGTHFNHVLEHILIEILFLIGAHQRDENLCLGDENNCSKAVIETTKVETTSYLVPIGAEMIDSIVAEKSFLLEEKINKAKTIFAETELGPSTLAIVEAAEKRGIPWSREDSNSLIQLGYGKDLRLIRAAMTENTSLIAADTACNKDLTKQRLKKFSIPVPAGEIVRNETEAAAALAKIGAPVVVKPLDGRQGKGVSLNLSSAEEVKNAFREAKEFSRKVLVEESFEGKNYRVLVVAGKMVAASERMPCYIVGDGKHSIGELIEIENRHPLRGEGHEKPLTKIKINQILIAGLEKTGWKLNDVPPVDEEILLRIGNLSTGGTARDVTDEVHPNVRQICERAARIINLDICGIDLVLPDISAPMPKEKGGIIEINAAPGLRMHTHPSAGKPRQVGEAIVEMLYPENADGRIPIISITGTNGKTTVARMISHVLAEAGLSVGTTTTDGIYLNGHEIVKGDMTGPVSAQTILGDRSVEVAVLETARGGIVRRGLGYDWADTGIITNISEDHIGQDGIRSIDDLINIKALVAQRVGHSGTLIINADDQNSRRVLEREKVKETPKEIVYVSLDEGNPVIQNHLRAGGLAYFFKNGQIIESRGRMVQFIIEVAAIPVTMLGSAEFQVANVLTTIAACRSFGLSVPEINALKTFDNAAHNPGRNNLYRVGKGYALIDYGHNPDAFDAVCRMAINWKGRNVTGIIGVPGDRDNELIREAGRRAARGFQHIIVKEDKDLRGRKKGEVARILCEAINHENSNLRCDIVLDEVQAFSDALLEMAENEVIIMFYEKLEPIREILQKHGATPAISLENYQPKSGLVTA